MVTTKLTLSAEKSLIEKAKRVARSRNTSVSAMFSRYLTLLTKAEGEEATKIGPVTDRASGLVKMTGRKKPEDILAEALAEKHGLSR